MQASHASTTTTTRVTTTTTSGGMDSLSFDASYLTSLQGMLKLLQVMFGVLCFGLVVGGAVKGAVDSSLGLFLINADAAALMLVSFQYFVTSTLMIIASTLSCSTKTTLPRTIFYVLYDLFSTLLHLPTGIATIIIGSTHKDNVGNWGCYVAGGVFGLCTALAYLASVIIIVFSRRGH